jgi:hypothetical protein
MVLSSRDLIGCRDSVIKRDLNRRPMYVYRCDESKDERLQGKVEGSTRLVYTGLCGDWNI